MRNRCPVASATMTALLAVALPSATARAIDIELIFDADQSAIFMLNGQDRTLDLIPIMEAAAAHWEDILKDNHSITITYYWNPDPNEDPHACITAVDNFGRPTAATIVIRVDIPWYLDPDPDLDDEYDMQPKLYRDTHPAEQVTAFGGSVPEVFEVGYNGLRLGNQNPDLLSIVLHEMGHALGLVYHDNNPPCGAPNTECNTDHDYDLPANWVGGNIMNIRAYLHTDGSFDCAHLAAGGIQECNDDPECEAYQALMWTGPLPNRRQKPSATDVFAVARRSGYGVIDLPRKFWLGGLGFWSATSQWLGGRVPDALDDVYLIIQNGASSASISNANAVAMNITIDEGNALGVFGNRTLLVGNRINLLDGDLRVDAAASFAAADRIDIHPGSELLGAGEVDIGSRLVSGGLLRGLNGGTLRLHSNAAFGVFDIDGSPEFPFAGVQAVSGNVDIDGNWLDPNFDGVITVGSNRTFSFSNVLNLGGTVDLLGASGPATIDGPAVLRANVNVSGEGRFVGETTLDIPWLQMPASDDELVLAGITHYQGGFVTGDGILTQTGNAFIEDDFTIDCATFDWDGENGSSITTIWAGRTLTINSGKIENSQFVDGFDGTLNMLGAAVEVNTSGQWRLDGTIFMNIPAGALSVIDGENMDVQGLVRAANIAWMEAEIDILPGGEINTFNAGAIVVINSSADNAIDQGAITGPGTLNVTSGRSLVGNGLIETAIGSQGEIRADNGTLQLTGAINQIGTLGTESSTGILEVVQNWATGASGRIDLRGGTVRGGDIVCAGQMSGNGAVDVDTFDLEGLLLPGDPGIGTLLFTGDVLMAPTATSVIQINGPTQSVTYDFVRIFGDLRAGGLLRIIKSGSYNPPCGAEFRVFSHTGLLDQFDSYSGLDIGNGHRFFVDYTGNFVTLRVVPQGDLDGDGVVGQSDLGILLGDFNCVAPQGGQCAGDLNDDGQTNQADLGILLAAFGSNCPA